MKTLIISYSLTGNNSKLAKGIAESIGADFSELKETKKRTIFTILVDVLFNRTPQIIEPEKQLALYEHIVLVAPVWFGKIATPPRAVFKQYKNQIKSYSVISLSAGFDGKGTDLENELVKLSGIKPKAVLNLLISKLLPANPKPDRNTLDKYRLTDKDVVNLVNRVKNELNQLVTV